ncbi:DUF6167 family protein [Streptomyces sp. DSM 44917]|uniref:DUF6167 family protein n=1 Tax=Streptomyces boetiae TaxID=3075541 RepID=A0ABU2LBV5_9ACTN|nr:DUF6167 family protein [Streptomyces sp. DSM 44917]MDT0308782.1 DUF6167 family protein [Streptomyces sp. DSM 44917]
MFRRALWFTTGAAAGVWATTRVQRTLRALAPESLAVRAADRAAAAGRRVKVFALDVREGMAERENELHDALGLTGAPPAQTRALPPPSRRAALAPAPGPDDPNAPTGPAHPAAPTEKEDSDGVG